MTTVARRFLEDIYLKRVTEWPAGGTIQPVDLTKASPIRRRFSDAVMERPVEAVRAFWQQRIFSGRGVPPPELEHESDVVAYVQAHPNSIGYVSDEAPIGSAKALTITE